MPTSVTQISRFLSIALFIVAVAQTHYAQPDGYVEVEPMRRIPDARRNCYPETGLYDREKLAALATRPKCESINDLGVEPENESLVYWRADSDCHMRARTKVFRSNVEKKYKLFVNNIYGGCHASGWRAGWIVLEKLPAGYDLETIEVAVERDRRRPEEVFVFPKPPPTVERVPLDVHEIDIGGCLPMTGTSQWILKTADLLGNALSGTADEARCSEHFKTLNIDFDLHTLVGYSFHSGHCGRPPGLSFQAEKQTSSDLSGNRYVVTANFYSAGSNHCEEWRTYATWLLVPKLPEGYAFDFESKAMN